MHTHTRFLIFFFVLLNVFPLGSCTSDNNDTIPLPSLSLSLTGVDEAALALDTLRLDLRDVDTDQRFVFEESDAVLHIELKVLDASLALTHQSYILRGHDGVYEVHAAGILGWQYGVWDLLERAGALYAHPEQLLLPDEWCLTCLGTLEVTESPTYEMRGTHIHTMHPIEYESTLLGHEPETMERFRRLMAWLAARRQNYLEWSLLRTVDSDLWFEHARKMAVEAHTRGLQIGIVAPFAFRQQNSWMLLDPESNESWLAQIQEGVDELMVVPWDMLNVEMGASEFFKVSDVDQVEWLSLLAQDLALRYPGTRTASKVHISSDQYAKNYDNINFNFLPQFADPGMGVMPHSVQFYDLYRTAPTYGQVDFSEMRKFLLSQIGKRSVYYYPETAYWVSNDVDIPIFLPQYIYSRWNDLYRLRDAGMDGQINFSSGFEWGYWMNDFAAAWYAWKPEADYKVSLERIFAILGDSAKAATTQFDAMVRWQGDELLEQNGIRWLIAWDPADDIGELVEIFAQPVRIRLHHVLDMDQAGLSNFVAQERPQIERIAVAMAKQAEAWSQLKNDIPRYAIPLYNEIKNGVDINAIRGEYMLALYDGVVAQRGWELGGNPDLKKEAEAVFAYSRELMERALKVVSRQEQLYRFPFEEIAVDRDSYTSYPFGYLRTVTDLWYWEREYTMAADPENFKMFDSLYDLAKAGGF